LAFVDPQDILRIHHFLLMWFAFA